MWLRIKQRQVVARWTVLSLCLSVLLSGCAIWIQPGKSKEQAKADEAQCQKAALEKFPVVTEMRMSTPAQFEIVQPPAGQTCCAWQRYIPPKYSTYDINERERNGEVNGCMVSKGWQQDIVMPWDK